MPMWDKESTCKRWGDIRYNRFSVCHENPGAQGEQSGRAKRRMDKRGTGGKTLSGRKRIFLTMEEPMEGYLADKPEEILKIIDHLITNETEVMVLIKGADEVFTTNILELNYGDDSSQVGKSAEMFIKKLVPEGGNALFESTKKATAEFLIRKNFCSCTIENMGVHDASPHSGFLVSVPESIEITERRREKRVVYEMPEFVSVEFKLDKGPDKDKVYDLGVYDCSMHGLGFLVTEKDFDLLDILEVGDRIENITFYAAMALITLEVTVRHKTKITEGKYKDCFILGIESDGLIKSCALDEA